MSNIPKSWDIYQSLEKTRENRRTWWKKVYENLEICQKKLGQKPWTRGKTYGEHGETTEKCGKTTNRQSRKTTHRKHVFFFFFNLDKSKHNRTYHWDKNGKHGSDGIYPTMRISPTTCVEYGDFMTIWGHDFQFFIAKNMARSRWLTGKSSFFRGNIAFFHRKIMISGARAFCQRSMACFWVNYNISLTWIVGP